MEAEDLENPRVVDDATLSAIREILEPAVSDTVPDPTVLSVEQLALQLGAGSDEIDTDALRQQPEAGNQPDGDAGGDADDTDALADRVDDADLVALSKARIYDRRQCPKLASEYREQVAGEIGVEIDDLEKALDRDEIDSIPSDPKLLLG